MRVRLAGTIDKKIAYIIKQIAEETDQTLSRTMEQLLQLGIQIYLKNKKVINEDS